MPTLTSLRSRQNYLELKSNQMQQGFVDRTYTNKHGTMLELGKIKRLIQRDEERVQQLKDDTLSLMEQQHLGDSDGHEVDTGACQKKWGQLKASGFVLYQHCNKPYQIVLHLYSGSRRKGDIQSHAKFSERGSICKYMWLASTLLFAQAIATYPTTRIVCSE